MLHKCPFCLYSFCRLLRSFVLYCLRRIVAKRCDLTLTESTRGGRAPSQQDSEAEIWFDLFVNRRKWIMLVLFALNWRTARAHVSLNNSYNNWLNPGPLAMISVLKIGKMVNAVYVNMHAHTDAHTHTHTPSHCLLHLEMLMKSLLS